MPGGEDWLPLKDVIGATGVLEAALRLFFVAIAVATALRLRATPGLVLQIGIVGSLIVSPYLHASDLCLLSAAAWMVWEERTALAWRFTLAAGWVVASPFVFLTGFGPGLNRWPLIETALLVGLVAAAWWPLTTTADLRTRAPA